MFPGRRTSLKPLVPVKRAAQLPVSPTDREDVKKWANEILSAHELEINHIHLDCTSGAVYLKLIESLSDMRFPLNVVTDHPQGIQTHRYLRLALGFLEREGVINPGDISSDEVALGDERFQFYILRAMQTRLIGSPTSTPGGSPTGLLSRPKTGAPLARASVRPKTSSIFNIGHDPTRFSWEHPYIPFTGSSTRPVQSLMTQSTPVIARAVLPPIPPIVESPSSPIVELLPFPVVTEHPPPDCTGKYSLGIDFGASKVRYSLFSDDSQTPEVTVFDKQMYLTRNGRLVLEKPSESDLVQFPSIFGMIGRKFQDPEISDLIESFPFPVFENESSHTCVIEIGDEATKVRVTPEGIVSEILRELREQASSKAGEPVLDASISVPALFTSAQREAFRDSAENAGLHIAHLQASSILAARAIRKTGELPGVCMFIVVDCGASNTSVSLLQNTAEGVREVRTVGSDSISMGQVCKSGVDFCLSQMKSQTPEI
jgi:hypothetical protein